MSQAVRTIRQFFADDRGPTAVEYAVMLALIVLVCIAAVITVGTQTNKLFTQANNSISAASGS